MCSQVYFYPLLIQNFIVCIDDIERRSAKLSLDQVFGFVSLLKEENACRVVLILNEGELNDDDSQILAKYREKVIDLEVTYNPSVETNATLIANPDDYEQVFRVVHALSLNNIRVIQHAVWNVERFERLTEGQQKAVTEHLLRNVALFTCVYESYGPSISLTKLCLVDFAANSAAMVLDLPDKTPSKEKELAELANYVHGDFDDYVVNYLEHGYCDDTGLKKVLSGLSNKEKGAQLTTKFREIWDLIGGSLAITYDEVAGRIKDFLTNHWSEISLQDLVSLCNLAASLEVRGFEDLRERWIREKAPQLSFDSLQALKCKTENADSLRVIDECIVNLMRAVEPRDIVLRIAERGGWNREDLDILDRFSEDRFYEWISNDDDPDLLVHLRIFREVFNILTLTDDRCKQIAVRLEKAICRISQDDPLKKLQISRLLSIGKDAPGTGA